MKRSKSLAVKSRVVRRSLARMPAWLQCINEGAPSAIEFDEDVELAYPELHKSPAARTPRPWSLSRRKLRARLSRLGYRGPELATLVQTIVAGGQTVDGKTFSGWTRSEAEEKFGRQVARELRRGVAGRFVMLDEMGYYMLPGFARLFEECNVLRKTRPAISDAFALDTGEEDEVVSETVEQE